MCTVMSIKDFTPLLVRYFLLSTYIRLLEGMINILKIHFITIAYLFHKTPPKYNITGSQT